MRKKEIRSALKNVFAAPEPVRKETFLKRFPEPPITTGELLRLQLRYLRPGTLLLSALAFAALLFLGRAMSGNGIWFVSAFAPFLALSLLTSLFRSRACGMAELELSTRFSLKSVLLARMGAAAAIHTALLLAGVLLLGGSGYGILRAGAALLIPYSTTVSLALPLTRFYRGEKISYFCTFLSAAVSAGVLSLRFLGIGFPPMAALIVLGIENLIILKESTALIRRTEEHLWNFNWTV